MSAPPRRCCVQKDRLGPFRWARCEQLLLSAEHLPEPSSALHFLVLLPPPLPALTPRALKESTNITGLQVHPRPLPALKRIYTETLTGLSVLPASSVYRQATEALTKHRMAIVERAGEDISAAESELGTIVEVAIQDAEVEKKLVDKMGEWKA